MIATPGPLFLGLDTGGTFTDAVLWSEEGGVRAKAKALTTRHDLAVGISEAADRVLAAGGVPPEAVKLVSMSTTLATNALVEGQGGRAALVMIGFGEADLARDGLAQALGSDPVVFCPGGHDVHGGPQALDLGPLEAALPDLARTVTGFAVCAYFATRNPAHENLCRALIRERSGLPVTVSHELSAKLGGPRRALTTLLNARLVGMIDRLVAATEGFLAMRGIRAPLMVVRGDGALVSAGFARARPIETILSGPAASLVGARVLTGLDSAVVSDIGGTTTDVAVLENGRPRLDPDGATVGGFRTMVEAVAMRTTGLGGDSEVGLEEGALTPKLRLGPRRLVPLSLLGVRHGGALREHLERQLRAPSPSRLDGRFAVRTGLPENFSAGLSAVEAKLYERIGAAPLPLDVGLTATAQLATLDRLVARGLVHLSGFTPSDAAHVLNRQSNWNRDVAHLGAELFARKRGGRGAVLAPSAEALAERVLEAVTRASAEAVLEAAFSEDGLDGREALADPLVQRALSGEGGVSRLALSLDRPVVGLGASAGLHYASLPGLLNVPCEVPAHADVANALGAVAGQVRVSAEAGVTQPQEGLFRVASAREVRDFSSDAAALEAAAAAARLLAAEKAEAAGADRAEVELFREEDWATVEGKRMLVAARVVAVAAGRPRIAA